MNNLLQYILTFFNEVPESAPSNFALVKISSTSINATWGTLISFSNWNGIGLGYKVHYRPKSVGSGNWTSVLISGIGNRQYIAKRLLKNTVYEFKVAARTAKGSGKFSGLKEEKTMEDGMNFTHTVFVSSATILTCGIFHYFGNR